MSISKRKVVGIVLIAAAVMGALAIQFFGPGLISTQSLPIPDPAPGMIKASSITATSHRWPSMVLIALVGAACYFFPRERKHHDGAA
jgi:hypothetical protein